MAIDWKYGRKGFIRLVDEEDIPETHKRMNLHYLRTLPYEVESTEPAHIHEYVAPIVLSKGYSFTTIESRERKEYPFRYIDNRTLTHTVTRDVNETEIRELLNDYTSTVEQLKTRKDKILYDKGIYVISYGNWRVTNTWKYGIAATDIVYSAGETFERTNPSLYIPSYRTVVVTRNITVAVAQALLNRYSDTTIPPLRNAVYNSARSFNSQGNPESDNYFTAYVKLAYK